MPVSSYSSQLTFRVSTAAIAKFVELSTKHSDLLRQQISESELKKLEAELANLSINLPPPHEPPEPEKFEPIKAEFDLPEFDKYGLSRADYEEFCTKLNREITYDIDRLASYIGANHKIAKEINERILTNKQALKSKERAQRAYARMKERMQKAEARRLRQAQSRAVKRIQQEKARIEKRIQCIKKRALSHSSLIEYFFTLGMQTFEAETCGYKINRANQKSNVGKAAH